MDTNIAIYFLDGKLTPEAQRFLQPILNTHCFLSVITQIELLGWSFATLEDEQQAQAFVATATIFDLSEAVVSTTINLRKTHAIKLPDAIIAATALVHDFTLLTRNVTDFSKLSELTVVNPMG